MLADNAEEARMTKMHQMHRHLAFAGSMHECMSDYCGV